jgi:hypothetical protein
MQFIDLKTQIGRSKTQDFLEAQVALTEFLNRKLLGEKQDGKLEFRAKRLVKSWWENPNRPTVVVGTCGLKIVGCELEFGIGTIKVKKWMTRFIEDKHSVHVLSPNAVALGYANGFQLFITAVNKAPNLVARNGTNIMFWKAADELIPPTNSPLFVALERAKTLGYLDYLKGQA